VRYGWSGASLSERLEQLMEDPRVGELRALVIGHWEHEAGDDVPGFLLGAAPQLTALEALFVGDISCDENEVSWIEQFELGRVVNVFKSLKVFKARGGMGLGLTGMDNPTLETLIVETGGLGAEVVHAVAAAKLPNLKHLELWTGSSGYGSSVAFEDLKPLVIGSDYPENKYPFPKLEYLGIRNCEHADEVAELLRDAPVMGQLKVLDLSLGILTDRGMAALIENPKIELLASVIIDQTYATPDMVERLEARGVVVSAGELREGEDDYWYVEVGE
jgi:hypothetical protein